MNGTFKKTSETQNAQYEYTTDAMVVQGNYVKNIKDGNLLSVSGSCYRKGEKGGHGEFFGSFNGYVRENNEVRYNMSEMSRADANAVWAAVDEIEACVTGENETAENE